MQNSKNKKGTLLFNLKKSNSVQNIFTTWKLLCSYKDMQFNSKLKPKGFQKKENYTKQAANTKKMQKQVPGKLMGGFWSVVEHMIEN